MRLASLTELKLLEGRLFIDTHGRAATSSLRVVTEMGRVEHIGTQFQVSTDDAEGDEGQRLRSSMPYMRTPFFSEEERREVMARAFQS